MPLWVSVHVTNTDLLERSCICAESASVALKAMQLESNGGAFVASIEKLPEIERIRNALVKALGAMQEIKHRTKQAHYNTK
jgi:hypothetical protein